MYILGISAFYHDSAATLVFNGEIIAAAQEERFSRIKNDSSFPVQAIRYCLQEASISLDDVSFITFYEKPLLKFERIIETHVCYAPAGLKSFIFSMPIWIKEKLFQKRLILKNLKNLTTDSVALKTKLLFTEHHMSHAASAFYPSPYAEAIIVTLDGVGEWATATIGVGKGELIDIKKEIRFPHSLGLLYSAFTYYLGFKVNSDEYKVMGLAPYGQPHYSEMIKKELINISDDGSFWLNMKYFGYGTGLRMINKRFEKLFGMPTRQPGEKLTEFHAHIAASIQHITEEVVLKIIKHASSEYGINNICLAGGVALNCVANGKIIRTYPEKNIWIQPAAGDAGGALGAALFTAYQKGVKRKVLSHDSMNGSLLGPFYSNKYVEDFLKQRGTEHEFINDFQSLCKIIANELSKGKIVGWYQGRMEYGPRALGNRSILADPRNPNMQSELNLKTKFRENFRPFAPVILREHVTQYFNLNVESPYMLIVDLLKKEKRLRPPSTTKDILDKVKDIRSEIPAVTHIDYSARIQTADTYRNLRLHQLLTAFYNLTKCPLLVNTSFNVNNEPIVCSPEDALNCFYTSKIDLLVIGNFIVRKRNQ
jgi:carbamoyltransferase